MKKEKTKVENQKATKKEDVVNKTDEEIAKIMTKKKVPKEVSQEIFKKIFKNLILAIVVMIYFITCNILYTQLQMEQMELVMQAMSGVFLLASIILLEFAYKRDSGTLLMTAIELLVLSMHALFIHHVITIYQFNFRTYLLTSSYLFAIYYILKSTIIYTRARIKYVKSLSDISEIVKDEPIIKEAKKRKEEPIVDNKEEVKQEKKEKDTKKRKTKKKEIVTETKKETKKKKEEVTEIKKETKKSNQSEEKKENNKEKNKESKKQPKTKK